MELFRFQYAEYLYGLLAIPLLVIIYAMMVSWKKKALNEFGSSEIIKQLMSNVSSTKPLIKFIKILM